MVSETFDPAAWQSVQGFAFEDITYHRAVGQGTVRIAFNRVHSAPTGRSSGLFGLPPACCLVNPGAPRIASSGLPLR